MGGSYVAAILFCGLHWNDGYKLFVPLAATEFHFASDFGKNGVIAAHAHAGAWMPHGAALTDDDIAGDHSLAAKRFDAKTAASRVAAVAG